MRRFFYITTVLLLYVSGCSLKSDYVNRIEQQQKQKIADLYNPLRSPMDSSELATFSGVEHFKVDKSWNVEASVQWLPATGLFDFAHSGGNFRPYFKAALLHFNIHGKPHELTAYQNEQMRTKRILFVPFSDLTNGKRTYSGGRYLDVEYQPNMTKVNLEFNLCYFPYCAFSHKYSCPIVPKENALNIEVNAGECFIVNR